MAYPTELWALTGLWVGAILTVAIYSYMLYKENPLYRLAEHVYIGIAFAIVAVVAVQNTNRIAVTPLLNGEIVFIIPLLLGLGMYTVFIEKYRWVSRYSIATLVGVMLAVVTSGILIPNIINQVASTITPPMGSTMMDWVNFFYIGFGTICSVSYFLFTREHTGILAPTARLGRLVLMVGLGVMFGNTVLFRMAMLAGRIEYLLQVVGILPL
ncbi:MAG: hypothetical protein NWE89_03380 [Candidatus Bathyarchaeota archaeon]|nr:hypothetical protein [Candidatus Bathyarchaeota archaeon]